MIDINQREALRALQTEASIIEQDNNYLEQDTLSYEQMLDNELEAATINTPYTLKDFHEAINVVLATRRRIKTKNLKKRHIRRSIKHCNALFVITEYLHEELLRVSQTVKTSRDPIRSMCEAVIVPPKLLGMRYALSPSKHAPTLRFTQLKYLDERGDDLGWRSWAIVIEEKGKAPDVRHLPETTNAYFATINDSIQEQLNGRRITMVCDVKNYVCALFDEE